jgi:hypothetical protein
MVTVSEKHALDSIIEKENIIFSHCYQEMKLGA